MAPKKKSMAWDHFIDKGNNIGECKMCMSNISYKSGVSNLMKHVRRKHSFVKLELQDDEQQEHLMEIWLDPETEPQLSSQTSSTHMSTCGDVSSSISSSVPAAIRKDCDGTQRDIDDRIINLFAWDMQPFTIVEDKGFRHLMNFAFPNYVIPRQKYFVREVLPEQYESIKITTKALVNENATTICVTTSRWTSKNKDSYLAFVGHYINNDFLLQSVLLEFKVLEKGPISNCLVNELKIVTEEWNVADKILLVVSENGENFENAIVQIQWKHFTCYAHTLNLAIQKAMQKPEISDLLNKVENIVSKFENSNLASKKLKKNQEQMNKIQNRSFQEVIFPLNSKLLMLQRFAELKHDIKYALKNSDTFNLTAYEWEICESLIIILQPCEEALREMNHELVGGSSVLPMTVGLISALKEIGDPTYQKAKNIDVFLDEAETFRQDLLSEIKTRFANVENDKTFTTSMFLDPRFKLYFQNPSVAEETKKYIIALVTEMMNKTISTQSSTPMEASEIAAQSQSSIWKHYKDTMRQIRQPVTVKSRAAIEVKRYLEDSVLSREMSPIDWWRSKQITYPYLAKLARLKLNSMATSIPCERVFSVAENILKKHGNKLEKRSLQQLLFLQQNKT